ncbi:unnamed protein product [Hermetia illucens]|uniref:Protein amnionless n=1 Tax=Hermetia illucens TaxID=343691 RepID=A0A7R8UG18_HERIL|nr:protein amnionless [Hermetia illucens]CAD7079914.1 unnamed protein product [Hermetia illucens]
MAATLPVVIVLICLMAGFTKSQYKLSHRTFSLQSDNVPAEIPCSSDKLKFPSNFDAVVQLPLSVSTKGIILPMDGALILPEGSALQFLPENHKNCRGKDVVSPLITQPVRINWFDSKTWKNLPDQELQSIPDVERIPCSGDTISMTVKRATSVDLDSARSLSHGNFYLDGREVSSVELQKFFKTELGQFMFKWADSTKVEAESSSVCGCHDERYTLEFQLRVCSELTEECPIPKCFNPIVPLGFCCEICGAAFRMYISDCSKFDQAGFERQIKELSKQMNFENKIFGYGSLIRENNRTFYQYIVTDSGDYNENSVRFVKEMQKKFTSGNREIFHSGMFYAPNSGFSIWTIIVSTFFVVVTFFLILYAHYERNIFSSGPFPSWLVFNRHRIFHSPFVFARFENNPVADVEVTESVVVGLEQGRVREDQEASATGTTTSFHNPMFCEKEIKQAETMKSSTPDAGKGSASKDDKQSTFTDSGHQMEELKDEDDGEEMVEVDLGSEISSGE